MTPPDPARPLDYAERPRGPRVRRPLLWVLVSILLLVGFFHFFVPLKLTSDADTARMKAARSDLDVIHGALDRFRIDTGRFPTAKEGLRALVDRPDGDNWNGPYVRSRRIMTDPWGNPYVYRAVADDKVMTVETRTLGPDGRDATSDDIAVTSLGTGGVSGAGKARRRSARRRR